MNKIMSASSTASLGPIDIERQGGRLVVRDGHHRVARAMALGETYIEAREWRRVRVR